MRRILLLALFVAACDDGSAKKELDIGVDDTDAGELLPAPDQRFKYVGALAAYTSPKNTNLLDGVTATLTGDHFFSPLAAGSGDYTNAQLDGGILGDSWSNLFEIAPVAATESMTAIARSGSASDFPVDAGSLLAYHLVLTSLDFSNGGFYVVTAAGGSSGVNVTSGHFLGARADLDAWVNNEAQNSRVVTALGNTGGLTQAFSFGQYGDGNDYSTQVLDATTATLTSQASTLASGGYTITAFGRSSSANFVLVGTKNPAVLGTRVAVTLTNSDPFAFSDAVVAQLQTGGAIVGQAFDGNSYYAIIEN